MMNLFLTCWIPLILGSFSISKAHTHEHVSAGIQYENKCNSQIARMSEPHSAALEPLTLTANNNISKTTLKDKSQRITDFQIMMTYSKNQYIDKTLFIKEVMDHPMAVVLITRPPRFGKSLLLSTLHYFFDDKFKNSAHIFSGLNIMQDKPELYELRNSLMNKFPVIFLDFKNAIGPTFKDTHEAIKEMISKVFQKFEFVVQGRNVENSTKTWFNNVMNKSTGIGEIENAIEFLCKCINLYYKHNKDAIILIDNYDTPIRESFINSYNTRMLKFMTRFLLITLKTNVFFAKAIITGVTTMGQENLFRDVGTMSKYTVFSTKFSEFFGFTRQEVHSLAKRSGISIEMEEKIYDIFDGYTFGDLTIFNPWSVMRYLWQNETDGGTSTDSEKLMRRMLTEYGLYPVLTIQQLLIGEQVTKIVEDFSSLELKNSEIAYWTYLIHLGYLTVMKQPVYEVGDFKAILRVPNIEIRNAISRILSECSEKVPNYQELVDSLINGNFEAAQIAMKNYIENAGVFSKPKGWAIHEDIFLDYVILMLRGVEVRYNTTRNVRRSTDTVFVEIMPIKDGTPIRVTIRHTNMLKVTWDKLKYRLCPHFKSVDKDKTEILIQYSNWFSDVCLRKFDEGLKKKVNKMV